MKKLKIPKEFSEQINSIRAMNTASNTLVDAQIKLLSQQMQLNNEQDEEILWDYIINGSDWMVDVVEMTLSDLLDETVDPPAYPEVPLEISFRQELESLINSHNQESGSDTPDWILAEYLVDCLYSFDNAVSRRERWYGRGTVPVEESPTAPTETR
jgi:hypothetical protein